MRCDTCLNGHAVVCGFDHLGSRIAGQLRRRGCAVVVVERNVNDALRRRAESAGCRLVEGDIREDDVLEQAGIKSAGCCIIVTGDDRANLEAAISARQVNDRAAVVVRLFDQGLAKCVEAAIGVQALSASFLASPAYVSAATDDSVAAIFDVDGCYLSLSYGNNEDMKRNDTRGVYVIRRGTDLRVGSGPAERSEPEDRLFASMCKGERRTFSPRHRRKKARTLARSVRGALLYLRPVHLLREIGRIWSHATAISRTILTILLAVGLFSVFMFSYVGNMRPLDSLYFVVTTMTTTGYGDINLQHAPAGLKVYGILVMLSGAALMATIYAIIADYVLTARMEYLLGRREVNLRDHTVVVGLGKVGYRVAHDLKMLGAEVVAIELNEDSDNVSAARSMFPVIIGDGSRPSILKKAGVGRASAILTLTDDPMINLSVALHARESNPKIKTILRTYELDLADKFANFGLDAVLSTSAIAAPAFVDAALYPGVQGSFKYGDENILVACHTVDAGSPLLGKSVKDVGELMGIAVVLAADNTHAGYRLATPDEVLRKEQRVVALLAREKIRLLS